MHNFEVYLMWRCHKVEQVCVRDVSWICLIWFSSSISLTCSTGDLHTFRSIRLFHPALSLLCNGFSKSAGVQVRSLDILPSTCVNLESPQIPSVKAVLCFCFGKEVLHLTWVFLLSNDVWCQCHSMIEVYLISSVLNCCYVAGFVTDGTRQHLSSIWP